MLDRERWAWSWSRFLGSQPAGDLVINPVVGCRYFPPGPQLLCQPKRSPPWLVPNYAAWWQRHTGVNSLPKAITQWCWWHYRFQTITVSDTKDLFSCQAHIRSHYSIIIIRLLLDNVEHDVMDSGKLGVNANLFLVNKKTGLTGQWTYVLPFLSNIRQTCICTYAS